MVEFLLDTFGDMVLLNEDFVAWLSKKLGYYRIHGLNDIIVKYTSEKGMWRPRHSLLKSQHQEIYGYWLKPEVSIVTLDTRGRRDEIRASKAMYQTKYKHLLGIDDENIKAKEAIMKKTGNKKEIISAKKRRH